MEVLDVFCGSIFFFILMFAFLSNVRVFPASSQRKVALRQGDVSIAAAFLHEGLVPCSPHLSTVAFTIHILELYHNASL